MVPSLVLASVLSPKITELYARRNFKELKARYNMILLLSVLIGLGTVAVVLFFGKSMLGLFFSGQDLEKIMPMLYIMIPIFFTQMVTSIIPTGFTVATGHASISTKILIVFGVLNVILDYIFINNFGYFGVVYATIICKFFADTFFILIYGRKIYKL
jgi:O-antigen/teichoic acid export membrane protein